MPDDKPIPANLNLKITEEERWAFKEFCVKHRISQVEAFRRAIPLLKEHLERQDDDPHFDGDRK